MGWAGRRNGDLLALAEQDFDVLVTVDRKLPYQQLIPGRAIAVVVLLATRNKLEFIRPLIPQVEQVLQDIQPGEVREIRG
mgnify:FL=1